MTDVAVPLCAPNRAAAGIAAVRAVRVAAWLDRCPSADIRLASARRIGFAALL
jgi:hypothetical protein